MDIATLGIAVDSRQVKTAERDLESLQRTGARTERQTDQLSSAFSDANRQAAQTGATFRRTKVETDLLGNSIRRLAGPLATYLSVRQIANAADEWTNLNNRLKLVTDSSEELAAAQSAIFDIAQSTRQSLSSSGELYQRIATNADNLGLSLNEVSGVVKTISQTLAISGASAQSASAALVQLGQAFASGTLRGEELNSVMEQAPALSKAIAEGLGVTIGQLREMGQEGELTSESVISALQRMSASIEADFSKTSGTISQAFTQLNNALTRTIGTLNEATGASRTFARGISNLAASIASLSAGPLEKLEREREQLRQQLDAGVQSGGLAPWVAEDLERRVNSLTSEIIELRGQRNLLINDKPLRFDKDVVDLEAATAAFASARAAVEEYAKSAKAAEAAQKAIETAEKNRLRSIRELVAELEKEAITVGMTADELKRYELVLLGATKAEIERARAAQESIKLYREQRELIESLTSAKPFEEWEDEYLKAEGERLGKIVGANDDAAKSVAETWKTAGERIQGHLADYIFDPFSKGLDGMIDGFGKMLQRLAAEAAAAEIVDWFRRLGQTTTATGGSSGDFDWTKALATVGSWFSFDGGGFTGAGSRFGGLDGRGGFLAMVHPNETIVDHTKGQSVGGSIQIGQMVFPNVRTEREAREATGAAARQLSRLAQSGQRYS